MGRVKPGKVNSQRRRTRERAHGTHLFAPAAPNWTPRYNPSAALKKISKRIKAASGG